jgi:dipeptidyl-peptidase-3
MNMRGVLAFGKAFHLEMNQNSTPLSLNDASASDDNPLGVFEHNPYGSRNGQTGGGEKSSDSSMLNHKLVSLDRRTIYGEKHREGTMNGRAILALMTLATAWAQPNGGTPGTLVDRVGSTGFIQVKADSFRALQPREQILAYWLTQASIAIDPIVYDQNSRFGLRQKRILDAIAAHPEAVDSRVLPQIMAFAKLFWAAKGNHNDTTAQKFLPDVSFDQWKAAALAVHGKGGLPGFASAAALTKELEDLRASLFDPAFEPMITAKSPQGNLDILQASANNFYSGVKLTDLKSFTERYPLNSRMVKNASGALSEEVYRAGTPDGKIPAGMYAVYLRKAIEFLEKAIPYAEPGQDKVLRDLIRFYETGEVKDWLQFGQDWTVNNPPVDFANGFIEVYRDARAAKGTSQSFVSIRDAHTDSSKIAANAQYFEDHAPWAEQYKKKGVTPPRATAVETVIETGDFHVNTVGDNLPNENEIREKYGTKSFLLLSSSRAISEAAGFGAIEEFGASPEEIAISKKYGDEASAIMTAMHEIIGHGSGKLNPKLTQGSETYLKEYYSTLEEGRADLMALWSVWDPKVRELGLISSPDVAKAMYYQAARTALMQLRAIPKGDVIEEDHQRDRQMIANYIADQTGGIVHLNRNGKEYWTVTDFDKMRKGVGMLLAELMRIKAEGDYPAIKALVEKYGVHFDPHLRDQVIARYAKLNLPTYWAGVYPVLVPTMDAKGAVTKVELTYPRDYVKQNLSWAAMYR